MNKLSYFLKATAAVLAFGSTLCDAKLYTHITAENGAVEYDLTQNQGNGWYTEEHNRFKFGFKQADRTSTSPKQVGILTPTSAESFKGNGSLEFYIREYIDQKNRRPGYKVDISSVEPKQPFAPAVTEPKDWFHSFAMKIDPQEYSLPSGKSDHVIFEQWWQGSPFHPPISLVIVNKSAAK